MVGKTDFMTSLFVSLTDTENDKLHEYKYHTVITISYLIFQ